MSQWGVFRERRSTSKSEPTGSKDRLHVAPCTADGVVLSPHFITTSCPCSPRPQEGIWVHNDRERSHH